MAVTAKITDPYRRRPRHELPVGLGRCRQADSELQPSCEHEKSQGKVGKEANTKPYHAIVVSRVSEITSQVKSSHTTLYFCKSFLRDAARPAGTRGAMPILTALIPTREPLDAASPGAAFLRSAGFHVEELVGYASIFDAYSEGVARLQPADDDVVVLVHDDVSFDGRPSNFEQTLRRHLSLPGVGFVGAAGTRQLSPELVWWRNASGATALAGLVHHGEQRSFFGPFGRVVVLDGLLLAATGRTLRCVASQTSCGPPPLPPVLCGF